MKSTLILGAGLAAVANGKLYVNNTEHLQFMWKSFKEQHQRNYSTEEDAHRFEVFIANLKVIDERNAKEAGSAVHGINKFSDLSQEEFRARYLTAKKPSTPSQRNFAGDIKYDGVASSADWSGVLTTPVKDQGYCGSCWAFSATEQIESDAMRKGINYILSPEQITQCTQAAFGCGGGWTESAYNYVKNEGGISTDSSYPYTSYYGVTGTCHSDKSTEVVSISGFTTVSGETNMANYVLSTGPLSVCLDASSWNSYTGGIMTTCGQSVDHCVQAVGVDTGANGFWKVRNSWGTSWGESGYIRLAYGKNTCDITNDPTYVTIK